MVQERTTKADLEMVRALAPTLSEPGTSAAFAWCLAEIDALTAERDYLQNLTDDTLKLLEAHRELCGKHIALLERREQVARREGFEAARRKRTDDLGDEVEAFPLFSDWDAHLAEQRAGHEREVRTTEGEEAEG